MDSLPAVTQFTTGETSQTLYVEIRDDMFLRESSVFATTIQKVLLADGECQVKASQVSSCYHG